VFGTHAGADVKPLEAVARDAERSFMLPNLFERSYWLGHPLRWWLLMRWCPVRCWQLLGFQVKTVVLN
jgi:hypothetical protein